MKGTRNRLHGILALLAFGAVIAITMPAAASVTRAFKDTRHTKAFWHQATAKPAALGHGVRPVLKLRSQHVRSFELDRASMKNVLVARAARAHPRRAHQAARRLAPGPERQLPALRARAVGDHGAGPRAQASRDQDLQRPRHRRPRGDDPRRPEPARLPRVRALVDGAWYIDPYYHLDQSLYASYYGRDLSRTRRARSSSATPRAPSSRSTRATTTPTTPSPCTAAASRTNADVTITISDPEEHFATRTCTPRPTRGLVQRELRRRPRRQPRHAHRRGRRRQRLGLDELPGRARRRPDRRPADRRRPAHLPARADHRPGLRRLLRRPGERDGGQGRADQPRRPGLRGRPLDPPAADREQRPAQPRHLGRRDRAERALRRRGLLHAVAGHGLLEHDARAVRDRPDHRRLELRHRPPRARPAGRRRRQPRRRRPLEQGRRLHGHPDAGR